MIGPNGQSTKKIGFYKKSIKIYIHLFLYKCFYFCCKESTYDNQILLLMSFMCFIVFLEHSSSSLAFNMMLIFMENRNLSSALIWYFSNQVIKTSYFLSFFFLFLFFFLERRWIVLPST